MTEFRWWIGWPKGCERTPEQNELQREFLDKLGRRLDKGAREYGDRSFEQSPGRTVEELLEEIEDIAGWAFVLWVQARKRLGGVASGIEQDMMGDMDRNTYPPLVKGGQGKSPEQLEDSTNFVGLALAVLIGGLLGWLFLA